MEMLLDAAYLTEPSDFASSLPWDAKIVRHHKQMWTDAAPPRVLEMKALSTDG